MAFFGKRIERRVARLEEELFPSATCLSCFEKFRPWTKLNIDFVGDMTNGTTLTVNVPMTCSPPSMKKTCPTCIKRALRGRIDMDIIEAN